MWRYQHPVVKGMAAGLVFVVIAQVAVIFFMPLAWAVIAIPITDRITINLGDVAPYLGPLVAFGVWYDARKARKLAANAAASAAAADKKIENVSVQIDGLLAARDKAKVDEGKAEEKLIGEATAKTLADGQQQGRDDERARVAHGAAGAAPSPAALDSSGKPFPVADDRTATAAERSATALERSATATEEKK